MQSKEKLTLDARSLPEIAGNLAPFDRKELERTLAFNLKVTERTVYNWINGKTKPQDYMIRSAVANAVKKATGLNVTWKTIF